MVKLMRRWHLVAVATTAAVLTGLLASPANAQGLAGTAADQAGGIAQPAQRVELQLRGNSARGIQQVVDCFLSIGNPVNVNPGLNPPLGGVRVTAGIVCTAVVDRIQIFVGVAQAPPGDGFATNFNSIAGGADYSRSSLLITSIPVPCLGGYAYYGISDGQVELAGQVAYAIVNSAVVVPCP